MLIDGLKKSVYYQHVTKLYENSCKEFTVTVFTQKEDKMKRRIIALMLSLVMAGTLAACGGQGSSGGSDQSASEDGGASSGDEAITCDITVWTPQEDQDESNGNWIKTQCEAFAAEHEDWTINFTYEVCGEGDAYKTIKDDPEKAADVFLFAADQIPNLVSANAIAEFGGDTLEQIKSNNPEAMVEAVTFEDAVYGVPFTSNNWFMYYNKNIFSEDDVKSMETMLEKGKVSFPVSNSWYAGCMWLANGCEMFGADGTDETAGIDFGGEKGTQTTEYLVDLVSNPNFVNDADGAGMAGLADGSIGAIFSGNWDYENAKEAVGGEDNLGVAVPPTVAIGGSDKQLTPLASAKAIGVNPNCEYPQVAVKLAAYLGGVEGQSAHYEMRGVIPSITSIDVSDSLVAGIQQKTQDLAHIQPLNNSFGNYWTSVETMGKEIVAGNVTGDNAAEKTEEMNTAINSSTVE